jgi:leukotriene-A4 hydrolase
VYLESLLGEDTFNDFLRVYILKHEKSSINYEVLRKTWEDYILANVTVDPQKIIDTVDWDLWVHGPGLPP